MGKKIVRLKESDLIDVIKRVIKEQQNSYTPKPEDYTGEVKRTTSSSTSSKKTGRKFKSQLTNGVYRIFVDSDSLDAVDKFVDAEEVYGKNPVLKDYKNFNEIKPVLIGLTTGKIKI